MLPIDIATEKFAHTTDVTEFRDFLEGDFRTTYLDASLADLQIDAAGHVELCGKRLPFTRNFLEQVSKFIRMPLTYAYDIDFDLFLHNVDQRKKHKNRPIRIPVVSGRAVGLADGAYKPAVTTDVLDEIAANRGPGQWVFQKASLSDDGIEIDLLNDRKPIEPLPGDEIRDGLRITNSESGGYALKAALYTYRLICSNGAVLADQLGTVRWTYDRRMTYMASIRQVVRGLNVLAERNSAVTLAYEQATQTQMLEEDFSRTWRRVRSELSPEAADAVMGVTADHRREIQAAVRERASSGEPSVAAPWTVYELHNRITAAAKEHTFRRRARLEEIGGDTLALTAARN